jgi:hypothetical protein
MNVGELKKELDKYPDDMPVCVGNEDIYYVNSEPAYWDGILQRLIIDESKKPYYCIAGVKFTSKGSKLCLRTMGFKDVLLDNPEAIMQLDMGNSCDRKILEYKKMVEKARVEMRTIIREVEEEMKKKEKEKENE